MFGLLQSCGLVTLATSSVAVATASLNVSNAMAMQTAWTSQMSHHVVSVSTSNGFPSTPLTVNL